MNPQGRRFAIVVSRWNDFLTDKLLAGALDALAGLGVEENSIEVFKVPGSFELPLASLKAAESGRFDAVVALGVVIRGETAHFDLVAGEAAKGIAAAALKTGVPVMFGVVTTENVEQAINRCDVKAGNKGFEAALSAVEMISVCQAIGSGTGSSAENKAFPHAV